MASLITAPCADPSRKMRRELLWFIVTIFLQLPAVNKNQSATLTDSTGLEARLQSALALHGRLKIFENAQVRLWHKELNVNKEHSCSQPVYPDVGWRSALPGALRSPVYYIKHHCPSLPLRWM